MEVVAPIYLALRDNGVLLIDEIHSRVHELVTIELINMLNKQ
jgi:AAA15 family ATPase/GTPase